MHIDINDKTTLREIQETFSNYFPYLQIQFFRKPHEKYAASSDADRISSDVKAGTVTHNHSAGILHILPEHTAGTVETEFMQRFGLFVQILKKENEGWEQTTGMDDFTLKELNELGRNSSDEFIIEEYEEPFEEEEEKPGRFY